MTDAYTMQLPYFCLKLPQGAGHTCLWSNNFHQDILNGRSIRLHADARISVMTEKRHKGKKMKIKK